MRLYKTVLTIGGSDSCGGAGIQADIKTFSSLCCYGMSVITALTAQNTQGVQAIHQVPAKFVQQQLDSFYDDIRIDAIKTGLLLNSDIIDTVSKYVCDWKKRSLVVDPVMIAKNKDVLLDKPAEKALIGKLFPLATLVTPNIDEAEYILNMPITDLDTMKIAAKKLCDLGANAVLLKSGHLIKMQESVDCLYNKSENKFYLFSVPRINTKNTHGAGCTFSAAITSFMAQGHDLITAISNAKKYITQAILVGKQYHLGSGPGPTCHFHAHVK